MKIIRSLRLNYCSMVVSAAIGVSAAEPQVKLERLPQNGVQPQAALDDHGTLHLVYLKGEPTASDVMYCRRAPGQTAFSPPIQVNHIPGSAIAIGTIRGAQMALGRNGRVHVAWNGSEKASKPPGAGAPMLYTRMDETGNGFELERNLMTYTTHLDGGGSVAADDEGHVFVVWHAHRKTGPQEEIDRAVFLAASSDDGKSFTAERPINPAGTGVCGCCGLKAFAANHGVLGVLYRSATLQGNRNSELLISTNYGGDFTAKTAGEWRVSTCPMSMHSLGLGARGELIGMWEKQGQVYLGHISPEQSGIIASKSADGNTGNRRLPTFALGSGAGAPTIVAWTEGTGWEKGGTLAWECLDQNGNQTASGRVAGLPVWSYAAAVAEPGGRFTLLY